MKHFNLISSTSMNGAANAVTHVVPSSKAVIAPFAALLITAFALGTAGCGKNNNQSANQSQPVPQSVSNQNVAETTAPSSIPVAANQPETGKKNSVKGPVKRLALVRTFKDADSGVSFLYPRKAVLQAGEKAEKDSTSQDRLPMSYVAPGGSTLASVELPSNRKDEMGDLFLMNVNEELTADQCSQFPAGSQTVSDNSSTDASANQPVFTPGLKTSFHGIEYSELDKQNDQSVIRYYHRFVQGDSADKGVCYEFGMLVNAEPKQEADAAATSGHKDAFAKLEKILATVKIDSKKPSEAVGAVNTDSKKENKVVETAKTDSSATTDSSSKNAEGHTAETAKAITKDESPR